MNNPVINKSKEDKLLSLRFWFESNSKKYREFREDPTYHAILEAIQRRNYEPFLPIDIVQDVSKYHPEIITTLKTNVDDDFIIGRAIGSRLKQMVLRSMLKVNSEIPEKMRQKTFAVDDQIKEKFEEYVSNYLL